MPDEETAEKWFENYRWESEIICPRSGSPRVAIIKNVKPMPYHCRDYHRYFSVRTDTSMGSFKIFSHKWATVTFLYVTHLKGISSMKLHRDLDILQNTAWFMLNRVTEVFENEAGNLLFGTVEVNEIYIGGLEKNKT